MRILNREILESHGLKNGRHDALEILESGLRAADPYYNTKDLVKIENGCLYVGGKDFEPLNGPYSGIEQYPLSDIDRIFVFGAGKGLGQVAKALEEQLGEHLTGGHLILKHGDANELKRISVTFGGHPIPDQHCVEGCKTIVKMIHDAALTPRDIVFTIVGNGVSSLLTLPVEGLSLDAVMELTRMLQIERGATTGDLNLIRNEVDQLKGGRITRLLAPAKMIHLLSIDCNYGQTAFPGYKGLTEGNVWLHTLPDRSSADRAIDALRRLDAWDDVDQSIRDRLLNMTSQDEVLKKEEFESFGCRIFGVMPDSLGVMPAAMATARKLGYEPHLLSKGHFIEASESGKFCANIARLVETEDQPFTAPCAILVGGEKIVTVGKNGGVGGRNQEFALAAAPVLTNSSRVVIASADTDGTDGPGGYFDSDAKKLGISALAGGIIDSMTLAEAAEKQVNIREALKTHATSKALWDTDNAIWTTPSISVQDIAVILILQK